MPKTEAGPARRILLVEDHPVERAYLQNMLLALGCRRVAGVGSGAEALAALTRQSYDVLISDIAMGEGGGTRLQQAAQAQDAGRLKRMPPIIWISNLSDELRHSHVLACRPAARRRRRWPPVSRSVMQQALKTALHDIDDPDLSGRFAGPAPGAELRRALGTGEGMSVVLQPQLNLTTGRMVCGRGAVALGPSDAGHDRGRRFRAGRAQAGAGPGAVRAGRGTGAGGAAPHARRAHQVPIAINASAATLCSPDLPAQLEQLVARAGLPARLVKVELTEDEPVKDWLALSSVLNLLRVRGFELAMDDFGAGIASMRLFSAMPSPS